jgi:fluoroacetyl-CoA thioesterase
MTDIRPGLTSEIKHIVQESDTASSSGGQNLPKVLSTPRVIGWMEGAAHAAVVNLVEEQQSTVGTMVNMRHLAATPVGMEVTVKAELLEVKGRSLLFQVEAWDRVEKIAEGQHERYIIDCDRFTSRLEKKTQG